MTTHSSSSLVRRAQNQLPSGVAKGAAKATNLWRSRSARDKPWLAEGLLIAAEAAAVAAEVCDHTQQQQLSQTCDGVSGREEAESLPSTQ